MLIRLARVRIDLIEHVDVGRIRVRADIEVEMVAVAALGALQIAIRDDRA
jgi:hypothetical protein